MSFCKGLPNDIGCDIGELGPTSVCITNGTSSGSVGYSLGAYDENTNPFDTSKS